MLSASGRAPNTSAKPAPRPANWSGVSAGLRQAETVAATDRAGAIRLVREVLEFAPTEIRAWQMLGELLQQEGLIEEAAESLDRALQLRNKGGDNKPKLPVSRRLAHILWNQGDRDTARAMLAILLLKHPNDEALVELKDLWEREGSR